MIFAAFNPEITMGNLLQIVTMLGGAIIVWAQLRVEIAVLKETLKFLRERLEAFEKRLDQIEKQNNKTT